MYVNLGACQSPYLLGTDICTLDTSFFSLEEKLHPAYYVGKGSLPVTL